VRVWLLDVNVLIALLDERHIFAAAARAWLSGVPGRRWASCPQTIAGTLRILSHPGYSKISRSIATIAEVLRETCASPRHEFWPEGLDVLDPGIIHHRALAGPLQLTDTCLLALAVKRDQTFATFDRRVKLEAVAGAEPRHLEILSPLAA
jgi:toxin-antitoxin system PIN domain toxin